MELKADKKVIVERNNKVVYDNGDTVVKVFSGSKPSADIMNEALNLTRAEQAGINVPSLVEISKVGNCWAVSTRKVEGKTIRQLIEEHPEKRTSISISLSILSWLFTLIKHRFLLVKKTSSPE